MIFNIIFPIKHFILIIYKNEFIILMDKIILKTFIIISLKCILLL